MTRTHARPGPVPCALVLAMALAGGDARAGETPSAGCPAIGARYASAQPVGSTFVADVATDATGAVYLATTRSTPGFVEGFGIERLDAGGSVLWSAEWQLGGAERAELAAADATGVTVVGSTRPLGAFPGVALVRFDSGGTKAWEAVYHPTDRDEARSLRGDGAGGAFVSGFDEDGAFLAHYGADGGLVYAVRAPGLLPARGIGLDDAGNAYFGGVRDDDVSAEVRRVSPAGAVTGTFSYTAGVGERLEDGALAVTPGGAVRLALGRSSLVDIPGNPPGLLGSLESHRIVGFAPDGGLAFERDLVGTAENGGIDGHGGPTHSALDANGNLFVTGSLRRYSAYVVPLHKLAPDGTLLWTRDLVALQSNVPEAVDLELDAGGAATVAAASLGTAPAFVARVEPDGHVAWMRAPIEGVEGPAMALAPDGTAFAAVTLPAKKKKLNQIELVRLDPPTTPAGGDLVAAKKLSFKRVFLDHQSRSTRVKNKSKTDCLALEFDTSGPPFFAGGTLVLPPRAKALLYVAFAPPSGENGPFEDTLHLRSSDALEPHREVRLKGER